jgi:hypothetical protein
MQTQGKIKEFERDGSRSHLAGYLANHFNRAAPEDVPYAKKRTIISTTLARQTLTLLQY